MLYLLRFGRALVQGAGGAGGSAGISPLTYLLSEGSVILHYLRLSFVPTPLCFDYHWPRATGLAACSHASSSPILVVGSIHALWRFRPLGSWDRSSSHPGADSSIFPSPISLRAPDVPAPRRGDARDRARRRRALVEAPEASARGVGRWGRVLLGSIPPAQPDYESAVRMYSTVIRDPPGQRATHFNSRQRAL